MLTVLPVLVIVLLLIYFMGVPIPIGYNRGKIKWLAWCKVGAHPMTVYWTEDYGFQTLHPEDGEGWEQKTGGLQ